MLLDILIILVISVPFFYFVTRYPVFSFYLFVTLMFDPGGLLGSYFGKSQLSGFNYIDILFFLSFIPLFSPKIEVYDIFRNRSFLVFLGVSLIFFLYHVLIFGFFISQPSFSEYFRFFLVRERQVIFGFLLIIPSYLIARQDLKLFYNFIIFSSATALFFYFGSLFSGIELVDIYKFERYKHSGIMRVGMTGEGFIKMVIPISILYYFYKVNIDYKKVSLFTGIVVLLYFGLTLTKTAYVSVIGYIISTVIFFNLIFRFDNIRLFFKVSAIGIFILVLIYIFFPNYLNYIGFAVEDILSLLVGDTTYNFGRTEGRLNDINSFLIIIEKNPFFGPGFGKLYSFVEETGFVYDATDVPILGNIARYGIIGILIYSITYFLIIKEIIDSILILKRIQVQKFFDENKYLIIIFIVLFSYFFTFFIFRGIQLYKELTVGNGRLILSLLTGIMFAIGHKLRESKIIFSNLKTLQN